MTLPFRTLITLWLATALPAGGQPGTRAGEIEVERDRKSQALKPEAPTKLERSLLRLKDDRILERFSTGFYGLRVKLGGLVAGGGFAAGPEYFRPDLAGGNVLVRGSYQASLKLFERSDLQLAFPRLAREKAFAELYAVRHNYPNLPYYGPGPDSEKTGRTRFRLEDTSVNATAGLRPWKPLRLGASVGYLLANTGPGTEKRYASASDTYPESATPGIREQSNFVAPSFFVQLDTRDDPLGARSGTNLLAEYSHYSDRDRSRFSFGRLDLEAQQFVPFFNQRRVIALRVRTNLTWTGAGNVVPFYLQPVLGGSDDLRGYRPFRFYGDNLIVANAEYRWEVFSGLDMAVFLDAGKVTRRRSQVNFHDLETAAGFGFRANARNHVWLRVDVGFSHEGFQVWFKFGDVFVRRPFGSASPRAVN